MGDPEKAARLESGEIERVADVLGCSLMARV